MRTYKYNECVKNRLKFSTVYEKMKNVRTPQRGIFWTHTVHTEVEVLVQISQQVQAQYYNNALVFLGAHHDQ